MNTTTRNIDYDVEEFALDNGCFAELRVEIAYNFYPGEAVVNYRDGSGYPSSPNEVEIVSTKINKAIVYADPASDVCYVLTDGNELAAIQAELNRQVDDDAGGLREQMETTCLRNYQASLGDDQYV